MLIVDLNLDPYSFTGSNQFNNGSSFAVNYESRIVAWSSCWPWWQKCRQQQVWCNTVIRLAFHNWQRPLTKQNDTPAGVLVEGATKLGFGPLKGAVSDQKTLQESENDTNCASKIPFQIPIIFYKKNWETNRWISGHTWSESDGKTSTCNTNMRRTRPRKLLLTTISTLTRNAQVSSKI